MEMPSPGDIFAERYRLEALLGKGGFAQVFRARLLNGDELVAIKILSPGRAGYDRETRARFAREVKLVGQVRSAHIVALKDSGESETGLLFLVFELLDGRDLSDVLDELGRLEPKIVEHVLRQVLGALRTAHRVGLLHRDIKPSNIRIFNDGVDPWRAKLMDFGIAKPTDAEATQITADNHLVGTLMYMSPEQLHKRPLSPASDVYSLGVTAYEMLMGRDAMHGGGIGGQLDRLMRSNALHVPDERAGHLKEVLNRMVSRDPEVRLKSATDVLDMLDMLDDDAATLVAGTPPIGVEQNTRYVPILPMIVALLVVVVVLAVVLAAPKGTDEPLRVHRPGAARGVDDLLKPTTGSLEPMRTIPVDTGTDAPEVGAQRPPPIPRLTAGCGTTPPPGYVGRAHDHEDGARDVVLYVPPNYDPSRPYPVVLMFHDSFETGRRITADSEIEGVAKRHGFVVMAPRDRELPAWVDAHDISAGPDAIERFGKVLCLDRHRVYAIGDGWGARLVERLRCHMPNLAGIATANFRVLPDCAPDRPTPHLHFVQSDNRSLPTSGGPSCFDGAEIVSVAEYTEAWREQNRAAGGPVVEEEHEHMRCQAWRGDATFMRCDVDGGRGWPGREAARRIDVRGCDGQPPRGAPMAEVAWRFFEAIEPPSDQSTTPH